MKGVMGQQNSCKTLIGVHSTISCTPIKVLQLLCKANMHPAMFSELYYNYEKWSDEKLCLECWVNIHKVFMLHCIFCRYSSLRVAY